MAKKQSQQSGSAGISAEVLADGRKAAADGFGLALEAWAWRRFCALSDVFGFSFASTVRRQVETELRAALAELLAQPGGNLGGGGESS